MISPLQLGASLYVPATRPDLVEIANREKYPDLRSVIFCTEDAVRAAELPDALHNLAHLLRRMEPCSLLRFVRVRNAAVMREIMAMDGSHQLNGFVIPKATRHNLPEFLELLRPEHGFQFMITLETADVFDATEMAALRTLLLAESIRRRVLTLRIGGNDLLQLLGLRRPRHQSIYATPLGLLIGQLVTTFRPHGFNLTGPVYEYLGRERSLARETRRDVAAGLFGKSAIHPAQVPVIDAEYRVAAEELHAAEKILADGALPVFRLHGAMCEPATHRRWAEAILQRARLYGVTCGPRATCRRSRS